MRQLGTRWTDDAMEQLIGNLLRYGVLLAAAVVLLGGLLYLVQHGSGQPAYHAFQGEPTALRNLHDVVLGAVALQSRSLIQLGLLLLIATPVARVALSLIAFAVQGDKMYVVITAIVLAVLGYSLVFGRV
jgi:uncharacterized membrane protein